MKLSYHPVSTTCRIYSGGLPGSRDSHGGRLDTLQLFSISQRRPLAAPHERTQSWAKVHEAVDGFAATLKGQSFVSL